MKTSAIIMTLVVVLGFVREAAAKLDAVVRRYIVKVAGHSVGIVECDFATFDDDPPEISTLVCFGPFGSHLFPYTANQVLIGFCVILAILIIVPAVLTVRWKKKQAAV